MDNTGVNKIDDLDPLNESKQSMSDKTKINQWDIIEDLATCDICGPAAARRVHEQSTSKQPSYI